MEQSSSSSSSNSTIYSIIFDISSLYHVLDIILPFGLSYWSIFHPKFHFFSNSEAKSEEKNRNLDVGAKHSTTSSNDESNDEDCLLGSDINMIMERLGIKDGLLQGKEIQEKWGFSELCGVFEEEPTLDEVKEAFDVFDQNRDGFIDAGELQRVLTVLGLRQGYELHECGKMIRAFDQNNDGKIDLNEFVKFMSSI